MSNLLNSLILASKPAKLRRLLLKIAAPTLSQKVEYGIFSRPNYAYGIYHSALQAKQLGLGEITAIEFGVASGNGLIAMEEIAAEVERGTGIKINVVGFDTGEGMPGATDYRDLPYIWQKGFFRMDEAALRARLKRSSLILGQIAETMHSFVQSNPPPIGFISIDVDYYSSTKDVLTLFTEADNFFLPRVFCYLDDTIGDDWELHTEYAGELLAIQEFNAAHTEMKIAKIHGLMWKRQIPEAWNETMFIHHRFRHPKYCVYIYPNENWQIPLAPKL